jgi:nucleotide-binding universal stress UspA family protein
MSSNPLRILVGTDFSTPALAAVWRAGRLAHASGGELELVHVISPGDLPAYRMPGRSASRRRVLAQAMSTLGAMASEAQARFHIPVGTHLAVGTPHAQIAARADATGAGVVVVGPHGERPVRDLFIGSTAQRLRSVLHAPLLIARSRSTRRYERALIAVDFSDASAQAAHAAARLFPEAALHFLHVSDALFDGRLSMAGVGVDAIQAYRNEALMEASRALDRFIRSNGLQSRRASASVKQGYVPACIRETAVALGASVVAFGASGKSRLEASVLGSVSDAFSSGTGHDVLLASEARKPGRWRPDRTRQHEADARTASA